MKKRKNFVIGAAILLIITAACSVVDSSYIKINATNISNEIEKINDDRAEEVKFTTCNIFNDSLKDICGIMEKSELLYSKNKTDLMKHIEDLMNMSILDIKEVMQREINDIIKYSDNDLTKNEIEANYKTFIEEMEVRGVTDEMSFSDAMQLMSANRVKKDKKDETVECPFALIFSYGYGKASCMDSTPFPEVPYVTIACPYVFGCDWKYSEEYYGIKSSTSVFSITDGYKEFKGEQRGDSVFIYGFLFRMGASAISEAPVFIFGMALFLRVTELSTTLKTNEKLKRNEYIKGEEIEKTNLISLKNYIKTSEIINYLSNCKLIEESLTISEIPSYIPHKTIHINGNKDFKKPFEENGVISGSGTVTDPYLIENLEINAESTTGILIENTDAHFIIKNCYIYGGGEKDKDGILFEKVKNGKIMNCNVSYNDDGIFLRDSSNNEISSCSLFRNEGNIYLDKAKNNKIINCISKESVFGIWNVYNSSYNQIINCDFQNNLLGVTLLFGSSNNNVTGCNISHNFCGILSIFSSENKINYNKIYNNGNEQYSLGMLAAGSIENATNNWWGSSDGPGGRGSGNGNVIGWVNGNIFFDPWLINPVMNDDDETKATTMDENQLKSEWTILETETSKSISYLYSTFKKFLQIHPYLFPLIRQILRIK